ncbi:hypothetical protein VPH35_014056 [Triticum aestivum]
MSDGGAGGSWCDGGVADFPEESCSLVFQAGYAKSEGCSCMRKACKGVLFESMSGRVGDLCWSRGCGTGHQRGRISLSLLERQRAVAERPQAPGQRALALC